MASIAPRPLFKDNDLNGDPLSGGFLYTYESGTTTNKITYDSEDESTPNSNPITLDSRGETPLWLITGEAYRLRLEDSLGNLIWQKDNIIGGIVDGSVVSSIATLKDTPANDSGIVHVLGYYADGDGGGGLFYWDSASTASDNGGTVIELNSAPATGRWIRDFSGNVSVLWFGASGDYIVSGAINGSARDNTTIFNTCFDYCRTNELSARVPKGSYLVTDFLTCAVSLIGDQKGKIEDNVAYGSATWTTSVVNFDGCSIVWDKSTLAVGDVYLRNTSGDDTSDVKFKNITFYSLSSGGVGGGKLLVNDSSQSGTEYNLGQLPNFEDCHIVNFGTTITVNVYDNWTIKDAIFRGCQQVLFAGNDTPEQATSIKAVNCIFKTCGDTSTAFMEFDNVEGFIFDRCTFEKTSEVSLRIGLNQALSFVGCHINDASLNSAGDFITVVATAGFNVDNVSFDKCTGGGAVGNINLIQGANVATLTINDSQLTGVTVPLGTSNVTIMEYGTVIIDGTTGTGNHNKDTSAQFNYEDTIIGSGLINRVDNSDSQSISGGSGIATSNGALLSLTGDDSGGDAVLSAGTGTGKGDVSLVTSATKQVLVTNTDDATSPTTGAFTVAGGAGIEKDVSVGGDLVIETAGKGLQVNDGSNATMGRATMSSGTVTVSTTAVTANSNIFMNFQTTSGAGATQGIYVNARSAGVSFTAVCAGGGSGVFAWFIVEPA